MKKAGLFLLLLFVAAALAWVLIYALDNQPKRFNDRISLKQKEKIPYGFFAARQLIQKQFNGAQFLIEHTAPGEWKRISPNKSGQALFLIGDFDADEKEIKELELFAKAGNYIFIIGKEFSRDANYFFGFSTEDISNDDNVYSLDTDSLAVKLSAPRFTDATTYVYPGRRYSNYFDKVDHKYNIVLGRTAAGHPNFIQKKIGEGYFFVHTAPLAFSNYFVLHKNNYRYLEQAISVLPSTVSTIVWDEYYVSKPDKKEDPPNMLAVLFNFPSFRWALWTAIVTLLLLVLIEMRRKQRIIPAYEKPKNDSLDFVQTIGHLYYDQKNHGNLAQKMGVYFLDHVRQQYKLSTGTLDEHFIKQLQLKSHYPEKELERIVDFIQFAKTNILSESQLTQFYNDLEKFYQKT